MPQSKANLSRTANRRIGATMLFLEHNGDDFEADKPAYDAVYKMGYRAVQFQPSGKSDSWLDGVSQWAEEQEEETWTCAIDFFVDLDDPEADKPTAACISSDDAGKVERAKDNFEGFVAGSKRCRAKSLFGPFTAGLLGGHYEWTDAHNDRCVEGIKWMDSKVAAVQLPLDLEVINRFETGVDELDLLAELIGRASVSGWTKMGFDTCHQLFGEVDTVEAWKRHRLLAGKTSHFSESDRQIVLRLQALTKPKVLPYLATDDCPVECWNVEGFGSDAPAPILAALGIRRKPKFTGLQVMQKSFDNLVEGFASCG